MKNVFILGASGSFGRNAAEAFAAAGWQVRRFKRGQEDMAAAAMGADVIVNGLNPPNYKGWVSELPAIARQVVVAAKASGVTVIQPANVYNYGAQAGVWGADAPHAATTKKGKARIEMERVLRESGVQVIVLRTGGGWTLNPAGTSVTSCLPSLARGTPRGCRRFCLPLCRRIFPR